MTWVAGGHHVLGVEHLLGELGDGEGTVLLGSTGGEWGKTGHEKVETGEGDHVDGQLAEVSVQLTWESQAGSDTGHGGRDQVVQVTVGWGGELQGTEIGLDLANQSELLPEADIVEGLVINAVGLVGVLNELVDGEGGIVGLDDGV